MMIAKHSVFMRSAFALVLLCCAGLVQADSKNFGEYTVSWSVLPSTFLTPEIAKENNLQRSKGIGIVNVAIMQTSANGTLSPVAGQVEGRVTNDIQQVRFLAFRRIQEGSAVYFIAEYQYGTAELLTFNVTARPTGHDQELPVRFSQALFND
ncbi:DUF4426 domain-containing protein [Marinobacter psychrophilus]|jgi:hypothetical protein|uniref:DUF4426 domain-containing protein n=1 Tax=Marinobacter psychrophilus TaxID=330734 RepID=UPI001B7B1B96|nr:DUF4426 domain-containing protein [Marinobacter psychrophilus]MBQ0762599.1 DUF4426 domain-containing protein [Marinobacter psychrophilus]MBQ0845737.1 DUF4426 domain-containing protein [Marinobacter psychrophilus]